MRSHKNKPYGVVKSIKIKFDKRQDSDYNSTLSLCDLCDVIKKHSEDFIEKLFMDSMMEMIDTAHNWNVLTSNNNVFLCLQGGKRIRSARYVRGLIAESLNIIKAKK